VIECCSSTEGVKALKQLLKDPRVDLTLDDGKGRTVLWYAACFGRHEVVLWLLARGGDLGDVEKKALFVEEWYSPLEIAAKAGLQQNEEVVMMLERFRANPALTRYDIRLGLGLAVELAAELFALVVFLCDGLLQLKPVVSNPVTSSSSSSSSSPSSISAITIGASGAVRFFEIAQRLPLELQMVLCNKVFGSVKERILMRHSEEAFQSLVRML